MKKPQITEYTVEAPLTKPVRCAVIADLHNDDWEPLWEAIGEAKPDILLIAGDLMESFVPKQEKAYAFLTEAAKHYPVFYGPGNHEANLTEADYRRIRRTGVHLLLNESVRFGELCIGAVTMEISPKNPQIQRFLKRFCQTDGCRLLICHRPEWYQSELCGCPIPVIVSGHAHGGQMRPLGIALYAPGQGFFPRYTSGVHDGRLVISRGLSNHVRLPRLWNPPELPVVTLVPLVPMKEEQS